MPYDILNQPAGSPDWMVYRSEPLVGGLNNRYQAQYIPTTAYSDGFNVDLDDVTRPSKRDGYSSAMGSAGLVTTNTRPSGLLYFNPSAAANRKIILPVNDHNKTYYATAIGGNWTEVFTAATASIDPTISETILYVVNDFVVMLRGAGANPVSINTSAVAVVGGGTALDPPASGVDGCSFQNRAFILVAGAPTRLYYSKLIPTGAGFNFGGVTASAQWDTLASPVAPNTMGSFQLSPERGGIPVACRPWNQTSILVWFDSCIEEVIPGTAYGTAFFDGATRKVIENNIGCCSAFGVVASGNEFFFPDQYAQIRSLQQTISGEQQGVVGKPLSEAVKGFIPDRVNMQQTAKIRSVIFRDKMYVAFPLDTSTEANGVAVYSLATRLWEGVWKLTNSVQRWMVSNLRGFGDELYFTDGNVATVPMPDSVEATKVYRMLDSSYGDNGQPFVFEYISAAYDFGCPELVKIPHLLELDVRGDGGLNVEVAAQLNEDGRWQGLTTTLVTPPTSTYWISYPMSYPLVNPGLAALARLRAHLEELDNSGRCRFLRFRVREQTLAKRCQIAGLRVLAEPQPYEMEN